MRPVDLKATRERQLRPDCGDDASPLSRRNEASMREGPTPGMGGQVEGEGG